MLVAPLLFGCSSKETGSDTGVPDALNDQDGGTTIPDADIDADDPDADADVDGGPPEYVDWALFGRVDYRSTNNEIVACDSVIDLTGAAYTGECDGCDYAFAVTAEIQNENGDPDTCAHSTVLSFLSDGVRENLLFAHADEAYVEQDDLEVLVYNSVQVGFSMYYEATETSEAIRIEGPFWWQMYYEGITKNSTFSRDGDQLDWTFQFENTVATWDDFAMLDDCGEELTDQASEAFIGDQSQQDTVPCDGWQMDVWEVEVDDEGAGFEVLVDTIGEETTFDPAFVVNNPDGCVVLYADDGFDCSAPPPHYMCPAGSVEGGPGTYQILVFSYGQCTSTDVAYQIEISDARVADSLTLALDNVDRFENLVFTDQRIEVSGCATLFPEGVPDDVDACIPQQGEDAPEEDGVADTASGGLETDSGSADASEDSGTEPSTDTATDTASSAASSTEDSATW